MKRDRIIKTVYKSGVEGRGCLRNDWKKGIKEVLSFKDFSMFGVNGDKWHLMDVMLKFEQDNFMKGFSKNQLAGFESWWWQGIIYIYIHTHTSACTYV